MSKITNDGLTRSGTGCFIAVPIWPVGVKGLKWPFTIENWYYYDTLLVYYHISQVSNVKYHVDVAWLQQRHPFQRRPHPLQKDRTLSSPLAVSCRRWQTYVCRRVDQQVHQRSVPWDSTVQRQTKVQRPAALWITHRRTSINTTALKWFIF